MSEQPHRSLTADFINAFPDGTRDNSSYEDIEHALDLAGSPCQDASGKWLTLPERVAAIREACAKIAEAKRDEWAARAIAPEDTRDINPNNARIAGIAAAQVAMAIRQSR